MVTPTPIKKMEKKKKRTKKGEEELSCFLEKEGTFYFLP